MPKNPPEPLRTVVLGSCVLSVLPTIKGLDRERPHVKKAIIAARPEAVALPVSSEGLKGLKAIHRGRKIEFFLSHYEEIYAIKLSMFGKVAVPPPSFSEALEVCLAEKIPVKAIDMNETEFADAFCESVSSPNLIYHSLRWRWLKRKKFRVESAHDFALAWDRAVNSLKGFRNLEDRREEYMARQLLRLSRMHGRVLAILELERTEGILRRLGDERFVRRAGKEKAAAGDVTQKDEEE